MALGHFRDSGPFALALWVGVHWDIPVLADCGAWAWAAVQGLCLCVLPFDLLGLSVDLLSGPKEGLENPKPSFRVQGGWSSQDQVLGYFSGLATSISAHPSSHQLYLHSCPSIPSAWRLIPGEVSSPPSRLSSNTPPTFIKSPAPLPLVSGRWSSPPSASHTYCWCST